MLELIVKVGVVQGIAHHPWILAIVGAVIGMWFAGRRIGARAEAAALTAKRQEAVDLFARRRDAMAGESPR